MLERLVHHVEKSEDYRKLEKKRPDARHRAVFFFLVKRGLSVNICVLVVHILISQRVELRLHLDHLDRVLLNEKRYGEHNDLGYQRKQDYRKTVIVQEAIAETHHIPERRSHDRIYNFHC